MKLKEVLEVIHQEVIKQPLGIQKYLEELLILHFYLYLKRDRNVELEPEYITGFVKILTTGYRSYEDKELPQREISLCGVTVSVPLENWQGLSKVISEYARKTFSIDKFDIVAESKNPYYKSLFEIEKSSTQEALDYFATVPQYKNIAWKVNNCIYIQSESRLNTSLSTALLVSKCSFNFNKEGSIEIHCHTVQDEVKAIRILTFYNFHFHKSIQLFLDKTPKNVPTLEESESLLNPSLLKITPRDYQKIGIAYGIKNKRILLADDMGVGKTFQAIGIIQNLQSFPCLTIVPDSIYYDYINAWKQAADIEAVGISQIKESSKVVVVTYGQLDKAIKYESFFKSVIADESHYLKNRDTKRYKNALQIAMDKEVKVFCSGTPITTAAKDLIGQLFLLGYLTQGEITRFKKNYCSTNTTVEMLDNLKVYLETNCMIRRLKGEVAKELPEKIRKVIPIELKKNYKELYYKAYNDISKYLQEYKKVEDAKLKAAMRAETLVQINELRQIIAMGSVEDSCEIITNMYEQNGQIICFSFYVEPLKQLSELLKKQKLRTRIIDGSVNKKEDRFDIHNAFRAGEFDVMLVTYGTTAEGLNFVNSNCVYHLSKPWTPDKLAQGTDRTHRIGQTRNVYELVPVMKDTIDENVYKILCNKESLIKRAVGSETIVSQETIFSELIREEFKVEL